MSKALCLALLLACAGALHAMGRKPPEKKETPMENASQLIATETPNEWRGAFCAESRPSTRVITTLQEWEKLWRLGMNHTPPDIDFTKHFAVAVFLGSQPTGGYSVDFLEPLADARDVLIRYTVLAPSSKSFVIQAFTQPYAIKLFNKTERKISLAEMKS